MQACKDLKCYCSKHEWAATTALFLSVAVLLTTVWAATSFHAQLGYWLEQDRLAYGLLIGALVLLDVMLIFGLLCLAFSDCKDEQDRYTYRGRRMEHPPLPLQWVECLGRNPLRHAANKTPAGAS